MIKERDEMEKTAPGTMGTVEISHNIRKALKEIRQDAADMAKLQKAEHESYVKKNKEVPEKEQQIEKRYFTPQINERQRKSISERISNANCHKIKYPQ